jgi:hypothetical protein
MAEITRAEFEQLRAEITEIRDIADATLCALNGSKRERWIEVAQTKRWDRRFSREPRLFPAVPYPANQRLIDHDFLNLAEVSEARRSDVAALPRIGRKSMEKIDQALAEHGLMWEPESTDAEAVTV